MTKLLFVAFTLLVSFASFIQAQTKEEFQVARERYAKLEKLSQKLPLKQTGLQGVDGLATGSTAVMVESMQITPLIENLYYRSIGESNDGIADVTVKKPTLEECEELAVRITNQSLAAKATAELVKGASDDVKGLKNPLTAAKAVKSVDFSKDVLAIIGEESVFQVKAIAEIIKTIKSADNL